MVSLKEPHELMEEFREEHRKFLKTRIDNQYTPEVITDGSHPMDPDRQYVTIGDEEKWDTAEYIVNQIDDVDTLRDMLCNSLYEQFRDLDPMDANLESSLIDSFMEMYNNRITG